MLKVAIVGCGLISAKKHIPAFLGIEDKVRVIALCDTNEEALKKAAKNFGVEKTYRDISAMLLQEKPDIVDICTPPQTHLKLAMEAIEKGANVFIEKPMALKVSDCDTMIEAAAKHKKRICVVHNQIFNPAFSRAREEVSRGAIGDFLGINIFLSTPADYITSRKEHWAHRLPGGILGETGPHAVYLSSVFLKNIYDADILAKKMLPQYAWSNFEDFRITLLAENGAASITLSYASNQWAADVYVLGTKGIFKIDLQSQLVLKYNRPKLDVISVGLSVSNSALQALGAVALNGIRYIFGRKSDAHHIGIRKFVDSILEDRPAPITVEDARETVRIMEMLVNKLKAV